MAEKIIYIDKADIIVSPALPENKVAAADMNEIKSVVNTNADLTPVLQPVLQTYNMPTTLDNHTLDLGQEVFLESLNQSGVDLTEAAPKLIIISDIDPSGIAICILASNTDLSIGALYGVNTTAALDTELVKMITYGSIKGIDTSMFSPGAVLYASAIAGEFTETRPLINAFPIGRVIRVDALTGVIFINTTAAISVDPVLSPVAFSRIYLTADEITIVAGTFYASNTESKGLIVTVDVPVITDDDQKVFMPQDHISTPYLGEGLVSKGAYEAVLEVILDQDFSSQRYSVEIYLTDIDGVPKDSLSGLPAGDLGVPPIVILNSPLLNLAAGITTIVNLDGAVVADITAAIDDRIRYHISCEKVGTMGATITHHVKLGSDHGTSLLLPTVIKASEVSYDNVGSGLIGTNVQQAIDELKGLIDALTP